MPIALQNAALFMYSFMGNLIMAKLEHSFILKSKHYCLFSRRYPAYHKVMINLDSDEEQRLKLANRVKEAVKSMGRGGQVQIAAKCDVSPTALTGWMKTGRISKASIEVVSSMSGYNLSWLITGRGEKLKRPNSDILASVHNNTRELSNDRRASKSGKVPLIGWTQAGAFTEAINLYEIGDAEDWLDCPDPHGDRTFALKVVNDSMVSQYPGQKSYPEGTIIYIDPDREIVNGSKVIAKILDSNQATFKVYREDGDQRWLFPLNPLYDKIPFVEGMHICGVLIGSYTPE